MPEPGLDQTIARHALEIMRLREALKNVKAFVVGDRVPNWANDNMTFVTRGKIADICDIALNPELAETR